MLLLLHEEDIITRCLRHRRTRKVDRVIPALKRARVHRYISSRRDR